MVGQKVPSVAVLSFGQIQFRANTNCPVQKPVREEAVPRLRRNTCPSCPK